MAERSLIFFDIDGTLLNHEKKLPASTKAAIYKLKEKGHEVAIATGRAPFMFQNLLEELDIQSFVSYNGQYVVFDQEVIDTNPLNLNALKRLTEAALERNHPIVYMDHEDMKATVSEHAYIKESIETLKIERFPTYDPHYYKDRDLYQSLLFCPKGEEEFYKETFPEFEFIRWHPVSVDVLPKGGSKANGVQKIVDKLGIASEHVYAFGDALNDMEMLKKVKNSVAMGNALSDVKDVAAFVTKSVEEDGIEYGLKMVGLL